MSRVGYRCELPAYPNGNLATLTKGMVYKGVWPN